MKLSDLWSPMSDLNQKQRDISNSVVGLSSCLLGIIMVASQVPSAQAQRMSPGWGGGGGSMNIPQRPAPAPQPAPAPPVVSPTPAPQPQVTYGTFRAYGPLPEGRVNVAVDGSFRQGQILGYNVLTQDNGSQGNDQMIIDGPEGREQVWINCWVTEEWKSYGPNSEQFIHAIVSQYCDW